MTAAVTATTSRGRWLWMAAGFAVTGASQLGSQLLLGRLLGPADFGQVATLTNLMNLVGIPLVAVQITVTGWVARGGSSLPTARRAALWGVSLGAVAVVLAPWWGSGLAVSSIAACRAAALFVPAAAILSVARGDAVGQGRTQALSVAMIVTAVLRLVAVALAASTFGVVGATLAVAATELALAVVLLVVVRPVGERRGAVNGREAAGAAYTQVAMWIVINVDLLWARRLLEPADAGRYLAAGSVAVGLVSFGQAYLWHRAPASTDATAGPGIVARSAAIVAVVAVVAMPVAAVALPVLLGGDFTGLTPLLALGGCWAVLASAVVSSTATQLIAGRRGLGRVVPLALVAVVTPPAWTAVLGHRPVALSLAALVNAAVAAVVLVVPQMRRRTVPLAPAAPLGTLPELDLADGTSTATATATATAAAAAASSTAAATGGAS